MKLKNKAFLHLKQYYMRCYVTLSKVCNFIARD